MGDLLGAYSINDAIWGGTKQYDMSINTANSAEVKAGSHITKEHTFTFCRSDQHKLLNVAANVPHKDDLSRYYEPNFLDNYYDEKISENIIDTTNSGENIAETNFANQEHQNYYDGREQQYVSQKYNGSLEQVTLKVAPNIILEEEEDDGIYQWADNYDQWDTTSYTPITNNDMGGSHLCNVDNPVFNLIKTKHDRTSKTRVGSKLSASSAKSDFYIGKRQS